MPDAEVVLFGLIAAAVILFWLSDRAAKRKAKRQGDSAPREVREGPSYRPWKFDPAGDPALEPAPEVSSDETTEGGSVGLPPEIAGLLTFERVVGGIGPLDISPDGREALMLHNGTMVTLFDVASGKAIKTWRDICPEEWLECWQGEYTLISCAGRRIVAHFDVNVIGQVIFTIDLESGATRLINEDEEGEFWGGDSMDTAVFSADGRYVATMGSGTKSHLTFDLERKTMGWVGDVRLEDIWPEMAAAPDGKRIAFDECNGEVQIWRLGDEPALGEKSEYASWPDYSPETSIICDERVGALGFDAEGERLLITEGGCTLTVATLKEDNWERFELALPGEDRGEFPSIGKLAWSRDGASAYLQRLSYSKPSYWLFRVDVASGEVTREWDLAEGFGVVALAPFSDFALLTSPDKTLRLLPLDGEAG